MLCRVGLHQGKLIRQGSYGALSVRQKQVQCLAGLLIFQKEVELQNFICNSLILKMLTAI